jgi:hypothetical protein
MLVLSLAVLICACGSGPTTPTAVVAPPAQPTFTLSGVISAVTPTRPTPLEGALIFAAGHRTTTDGEGRYSISGLEPSAFGCAVTGRVPVEGVRVDVSSMPCDEHAAGCVGFGEGFGLFQTATTDRNGIYSIPGVYLGNYNVIWAAKDGFEDPFPAHDPENAEGGRAINIDGDSRFDIQLVRR